MNIYFYHDIKILAKQQNLIFVFIYCFVIVFNKNMFQVLQLGDHELASGD
jgi:hypothetical protein